MATTAIPAHTMSDDTDFLKLYRQLGVEPGCTLQAFKQAYRRRVGALHPDRTKGAGDESDGLKELNRQYAASLAFHRRYRRLPGSLPAHATPFSTARAPPETAAAPPRRRPPETPYQPPNRWLLLILSLVAIIPLWALIPATDEGASDTGEPFPAALVEPTVPAPTLLHLGMDSASVARLLGVPIVDADDSGQWVYGASWIRFECDEVVDWYSSLLHPLPVDGPRSAASAQRKAPPKRPRRCRAAPQRKSVVDPATANPSRYAGIA